LGLLGLGGRFFSQVPLPPLPPLREQRRTLPFFPSPRVFFFFLRELIFDFSLPIPLEESPPSPIPREAPFFFWWVQIFLFMFPPGATGVLFFFFWQAFLYHPVLVLFQQYSSAPFSELFGTSVFSPFFLMLGGDGFFFWRF